MCGRYQFTGEEYGEIRQIVQEIHRRYGDGAFQPGEIRPTSAAPVLLDRGPALMRWGYQLPHSLVINARAETAGEKPLFRESVAMRRCVIPSTGFYEWDRDKRKHLFRLPGEQVLYMAGLYEKHPDHGGQCLHGLHPRPDAPGAPPGAAGALAAGAGDSRHPAPCPTAGVGGHLCRGTNLFLVRRSSESRLK